MYFSNNEKNTADFFMGHIRGCGSRKQNKNLFFFPSLAVVNKFGLWHLCVPHLAQPSLLYKNAKCFFDICNAEMAQWRRKS